MMKKLTILFFLLLTHLAYAQVPQGIPYQAAARNTAGQALVNTAVKVRFSILDSVATGTTVYQETHSTTTNNVGLFNVNVGMGTVATGTFAGINWGKNAKFMKMELDITGTGSSYVDMGTQQMMSVPYALYAGSISGSSTSSIPITHNYEVITGNKSIIMPNGINSIKVIAIGAGGGGCNGQWPINCQGAVGSSGGSGAYIETRISVQAGDSVSFIVGVPGSSNNCAAATNGTETSVYVNGVLFIRAGGGNGASGVYSPGIGGIPYKIQGLNAISANGNNGNPPPCGNNCWGAQAPGWDVSIFTNIGYGSTGNSPYSTGGGGIVLVDY